MKVTIDTDELFCEEGLSPNEVLKEAVIEKISENYKRILDKNLIQAVEKEKQAITATISDSIETKVNEALKPILDNLLDHEYVERDSWNEKEKTWTIREKIHSTIRELCVFKKTSYSSDQNVFTSSIITAASSQFKEFQSEWYKQVDAEFMADALKYAATKFEQKMKGR